MPRVEMSFITDDWYFLVTDMQKIYDHSIKHFLYNDYVTKDKLGIVR